MRVEVLIDTLDHNHERIPVGTHLELELEQAQQLLDVGAVRLTDDASGPSDQAKTKSEAKPTAQQKPAPAQKARKKA